MRKVFADAASALDGIVFDGMTVMAGGFGLCGIAENLILALRASGVKISPSFPTIAGWMISAWACCCRPVRSKR